MPIGFHSPSTGESLVERDGQMVGADTGIVIAPIVDGLPRFVSGHENYAEGNFGWQWKKWDTLGGTEEALRFKTSVIAERTGFTAEMLEGKTLLECGAGRGDDTLVLLRYPLAELHAFDLTTAIGLAADIIDDERAYFSQASITEIPYEDRSFDIVYCHRVLQHTPDPVASLRAISRKVKPGGILFAHSYKRSVRALNQFKYKYRPITKRISNERLAAFLDRWGEPMYRVHERTAGSHPLIIHALAGLMPLARMGTYGDFDRDQMVELSKLVTFDALAPTYDRPMTAAKMRTTIEREGFVIEHFENDRSASHICARARRTAG